MSPLEVNINNGTENKKASLKKKTLSHEKMPKPFHKISKTLENLFRGFMKPREVLEVTRFSHPYTFSFSSFSLIVGKEVFTNPLS